jgi:hypothetical protein
LDVVETGLKKLIIISLSKRVDDYVLMIESLSITFIIKSFIEAECVEKNACIK